MTKKISENEFDGVLTASIQKRYKYFISTIIGSFEVWGLFNGRGWTIYGDDKGNKIEPFWPRKEFAKFCVTDKNEPPFKPKKIPLAEFLHKWLPDIKNKGHLVGIFPNLTQNAGVVSPDHLKNDIEHQLSLAGYKLLFNEQGKVEILEV